MFEAIKKFLWDETIFVRVTRGAALGLGGLAASGTVDLPGWVAGLALFFGGMLGAGDKNPDA